jgi:hypothetical protein
VLRLPELQRELRLQVLLRQQEPLPGSVNQFAPPVLERLLELLLPGPQVPVCRLRVSRDWALFISTKNQRSLKLIPDATVMHGKPNLIVDHLNERAHLFCACVLIDRCVHRHARRCCLSPILKQLLAALVGYKNLVQSREVECSGMCLLARRLRTTFV